MVQSFIISSGLLKKWYISNVLSRSAVSLAFNRFGTSEHSKHPPLVIGHGLFGHKSNWNSVSKQIQRKLENQIYVVDFRNHGDSPHASSMKYQDMVEDMKLFINDVVKAETGFNSVHLLGHSMGGKVASLLAMDPEGSQLLSSVIIEDVSPTSESRNIHFKKYVAQMKGVDLKKSRRQISDDLAHVITDLPTRQFLLTNLAQHDESENRLRWKPNLDAIEDHIEHILRFTINDGVFHKPTLFVTGEKSQYVQESNHSSIRKLFPKVEFVSIPNASHWIHADEPSAFIDTVVNFLRKQT